jgi:hypothetical protein
MLIGANTVKNLHQHLRMLLKDWVKTLIWYLVSFKVQVTKLKDMSLWGIHKYYSGVVIKKGHLLSIMDKDLKEMLLHG